MAHADLTGRRFRGARGLVVLTAVAAWLGGCPPAAAPQETSPDAGVGDAPSFGVASFRPVLSPRFDVEIPLPDSKNWQVTDRKSRFLVLEHAATRSRLVVRLWREGEVMRHDGCERLARRLRELPEGGSEIDRRTVDSPTGFDTRVVTGVVAPAPGRPIVGYVVAFGALARRCFAYAFTTEATGQGAEGAVGERLAAMAAGSLERVRLQSELTPY